MSASRAKTSGRIVYRIMNEKGELSSGGSSPRWGIKGKTWLAIGQLKAHITLVTKRAARRNDGFHPYDSARVVPYEMHEIPIEDDPIAKALTLSRLKSL